MSAGTSRTKAIVVGAGIGGLTAAVALRRAGLDVEVYERASELTPVGFGLTVMSNAVRSLQSIGIELGIEKRGQVATSLQILTPRGHMLREMPLTDLYAKVGAPSVCIARGDLQAALLQEAGDLPIELGAVATGYEKTGDGVRVRFADGREATGDILIGADGIRSPIRRQVSAAAAGEPRQSGFLCWLALADFQHPRVVPGFNAQYWGRGTRFGLHDIGHGRVYWWVTKNIPAGQVWNGEKEPLVRSFHRWAPEIAEVIDLTPVDDILAVPAQDRPFLDQWGDGPVTLLGDAAHPMLPSLAQGGSSAIESAVVLAKSLKDASDPVAALRAYEDRRRERTRQMVEVSHELAKTEQVSNPIGMAARAAFLRLTPLDKLFQPYETAMTLPDAD